MNADGEFECIRDDIQQTNLNIVAAGEHVGDIERGNRSCKEGTRCEIHTCPYQWYLRKMIKGCLVKVTKDNKGLPLNTGLSCIYWLGTLVRYTARTDSNV